jgi:hypothetical protein
MCVYTHSNRNKKNIVYKKKIVLFLEHTHTHTQRSALGYARNNKFHATGQIYAEISNMLHIVLACTKETCGMQERILSNTLPHNVQDSLP